jgi:hypothetical protein
MNPPLELIGLGEIARRTGLCYNTAWRRITRHNIVHDAVNIEGENRKPMFVASRLPEIATTIGAQIQIAA